MPSQRGAAGTTSLSDDAAALEESAEELYEHAPAGYVSSLPGGLIVRVNETLLSWTGHSREDLVGRKRLQDLLAPGARIYYETHFAPLLHMQGSVREIAVEVLRADGGRLPVLLNATLVRDERGEPRVVRTTVFDASERRRYERELQRLRADAEARAHAVLALAHVDNGVLLVTPGGLLDLLNPAAELILGVAATDAVGRPVADAVPGWADVAAAAPLGRAAVVPVEWDGSERWLAVVGVDAGEGGVVWTIRDVTADHTLERLRTDVVAIVSHELRTPLTGVYGSAQTLLARYDDLSDDVRRQLLAMIVEQSERLSRLVDQILLTGSLESGNVAVPTSTSDVAALVDATLAPLSAESRARLLVDVRDDVLVAAGVEAVTQVLGNLLDNALKYSEGAVRLAVERQGEVVRFTVEDEGPGIPPSERERVFDRFYRLDPDLQRGVGGAGLGLYVARELTRRLGGRIELLPAERGTRIAIYLAAVESPA